MELGDPVLRNILDLFHMRDGVLAMDPRDLTGAMEPTDEKDARIARLEKLQDIHQKIIEELLDSSIKSFKAIQVISRGFDLSAQKDLAGELKELEKAEDVILLQALARKTE